MTHIRARKNTKNTKRTATLDTNAQALPEGMNCKDILSLLREIASSIRLPIGAIDLLAAYYSTTQDEDWCAGNPCKSWVQIKTASEWRGLNRSTIYRHNRALSDLGILAYADYGNYRRFGSRHHNDGIIIDESTFGVDLKPVIFKLQEFQALAAKISLDKQERLSLHRRISSLKTKIINSWPDNLDLDDDLKNVLHTPTRKEWTLERLRLIAEPLEKAWNMVVAWWQKQPQICHEEPADDQICSSEQDQGVVSENATQCDANCTTHIYKTNIPYFVNVKASGKNMPSAQTAARGDPPHATDSPPVSRQQNNGREFDQKQSSLPFSLADMMNIINVHCQGSVFQIMNEMPHNVSSLVECAERACCHLGIHRSAWLEAQRHMGTGIAAASVMVVQAKVSAGEIYNSPGGYLRGMTSKAKNNKLHITKTMRQLVRQVHMEGYSSD